MTATNARIGLFLLLTFLIPSACLAETASAGGSNSAVAAQKFTGSTNLGQGMPPISIGPFYSPEPAKDKHDDWVSSLSSLITSLVPLVKTGLWILLIVWLIRTFKTQIGELIERLKSVGIGGNQAEFDPAIENQRRSPAASQAETSTSPIATGVQPAVSVGAPESSPEIFALDNAATKPPKAEPGNDLTVEFEKAKGAFAMTPTQKVVLDKIHADVKASKFTPEQQIALGSMAMAQLATIGDFWRIYSFIYGSQLELMKRANTAPIMETDVMTFWLSVREKFPPLAQGSTMEVYVKFLLDNGLLEYRDAMYLITIKGKEFLMWCIGNNLSLEKPF